MQPRPAPPQLRRVCCYLLIYLHPSKVAAEGWSRQREAKSSTEAPLSPSLLARGRTTLPCARLLRRDPHNPAPVCAPPPEPCSSVLPVPTRQQGSAGQPVPPWGDNPISGTPLLHPQPILGSVGAAMGEAISDVPQGRASPRPPSPPWDPSSIPSLSPEPLVHAVSLISACFSRAV